MTPCACISALQLNCNILHVKLAIDGLCLIKASCLHLLTPLVSNLVVDGLLLLYLMHSLRECRLLEQPPVIVDELPLPRCSWQLWPAACKTRCMACAGHHLPLGRSAAR